MSDEVELRQKRGAVTVLALLVSLLLGYAPAAAQAETDRSARLGNAELVKRGSALRSAVRTSSDDADPEIAVLPPPARIRTELVSLRPDGAVPLTTAVAPRQAPALGYRARAPPAA